MKGYRGDKRTKQSENLGINDIVLTTYDVVRAEFPKTTRPENSELGPLHTTNWRRVILDEGRGSFAFSNSPLAHLHCKLISYETAKPTPSEELPHSELGTVGA